MSERPTTSDIDRILRVFAPPHLPDAPVPAVQGFGRQLVRVLGVGRRDKSIDPERPPRDAPAESIIVGAHTSQLPLAAMVSGVGNEVAVILGTWADDGRAPGPGALPRLQTLRSLLLGAYAAVDFADVGPESTNIRAALDHGGLVLGFPVARASPDGALPYDRLVRAMAEQPWASLVLAIPIGEQAITSLRNAVTNEIRLFEHTSASADKPDPITRYYNDLLETLMRNLGSGQAIGAWRTAVYLVGTKDSYPRLAGLWRGLFSPGQAGGEPLRVWPLEGVVGLARAWGFPDLSLQADQPNRYKAPFAFQTVLTSAQLAAYFHLPRFETPGFAVRAEPRLDFDTEPDVRVVKDRMFSLGKVALGSDTSVGRSYDIPIDNLKRHAFITGVTGSGKTVTMLNLVRGLDAAGVPFLVIEPTKSEYRRLAAEAGQKVEGRAALGKRISVFTLGDERVSPFRLNPFEPGGKSTSIGAHIDLLRSVFSAAFGMWTPLPQVLERCLYEVYADRGWDFASGQNRRGPGQRPPAAFPTLTDLSRKIEDVVSGLGYAPEITSNIKAALKTRVDGLRTGGKGRMLDVPQSYPVSTLLESPTILELEGMGDDDDKAFLIGLFLVQLAEFRREQMTEGMATDVPLQHLLVIEEAHRLLTNVQATGDQEQANPRAKAVESFTNLLSEIRAYGQGVAIIDQVPVRMAPDVIKNSDLKIAHRIVAGDDREMLARTMAMDERQSRALSRLRIGQAAAFHEGDDAPLLINVTPPQKTSPLAIDVAAVMASRRKELNLEPLLRRSAACLAVCKDLSVCDEARRLVDDPTTRRTFARLVLTLAEASEIRPDDGCLAELRAVISARMSPDSSLDALYPSFVVHASEWLALRRGAQNAWSFSRTETFETSLREFLLGQPEQPDELKRFHDALAKAHERAFPPFSRCQRICDQRRPPVCLYRWAAADFVPVFRTKLAAAEESGVEPTWVDTWKKVGHDASFELLGLEAGDTGADPTASARGRATLCLLQQTWEFDESLTSSDAAYRVDQFFPEGGDGVNE